MTLSTFIFAAYDARQDSIILAVLADPLEAPRASPLALLTGQSSRAVGALFEELRLCPQICSLMLCMGHQGSYAVMLWGSREAACWARILIKVVLIVTLMVFRALFLHHSFYNL